MTDPLVLTGPTGLTATLYLADCREVLPTLAAGSIDAVVTDPPYGVDLRAKRAKQRNGSVSVRVGNYASEDTPEYVRGTVVPAIVQCQHIAAAVLVTPGTRNAWSYPQPDELGW